MSIYILIDYVKRCRENGIEPELTDLKQFKAIFWRN